VQPVAARLDLGRHLGPPFGEFVAFEVRVDHQVCPLDGEARLGAPVGAQLGGPRRFDLVPLWSYRA
jgi:hypothetical protein